MDGETLIGIPTYNGHRRVEALLANLRQRTPRDIPHRVVVCDDSGKDRHRRLVREACARYAAVYIENERNLGVPASWNRLVRSSPDCPYAVLLNDDVLVDDGWLRPLVHAVSRNPKAASFSLHCHFITEQDAPAILCGPGAKAIPLNVHWRGGRLVRDERFPSMPGPPEDTTPGRVMCPAGCAFGFRREVYDAVGGFDERYFAFYEETDFGVSCAARGMPSFTLTVPWDNYHIWSATFGSAPEINAGRVMRESRGKFVEKWSARLGVGFNDAPEIHHLLMDRIPPTEISWLCRDGTERRGAL